MQQILIYAGIILGAIIVLGLIWTRLYRRAPKDAALIRTGFGGEKVVMDGGIMVLPVLHELSSVSLTTIKLRVERVARDSLLTLDKIRVDVIGQFHIRVAPRADAISTAATTLGKRVNEESAVSELVSAKLISALRSVAASMTMDDLHANRITFQQEVEKSLLNDLAKNGFELETVSITHFDQTDFQYLNENNAFDAVGLTKTRRTVEDNKRLRNDIEAENRVAIEQRNYEANQKSLEIAQNNEFAVNEQQRAIAMNRAENDAKTASETAMREQEAEQARISAAQATKTRQIEATRAEQEAQIAQDKAVAMARQDQQIAIQNKSRDESMAKAEADEARAKAITAAESVTTAQQVAAADRVKQIAVIDATRDAEQKAVSITVQAKAEKEAATNRADAINIGAKAEADALTTKARGEADSERLRAEAAEITNRVRAEGEQKLIEARNSQTEESMVFATKAALIEAMPAIIAEQVRPISAIDSIRIVDYAGMNKAVAAGGGEAGAQSGGNLADQAVAAAMRYRANMPMLNKLVEEAFGGDGDMNGLAAMINPVPAPVPVVQPTLAQVADTYAERPKKRRRDDDDVPQMQNEA